MIGVDEVGLGSIAGPLVVSGVVVSKDWDSPFVLDSKSLTALQRETACDLVKRECAGWMTVRLEASGIDLMGISEALKYLTSLVISNLYRVFNGVVVCDGTDDGTADYAVISPDHLKHVPKADLVIPAVSAASVLAKVTRDSDMLEYHKCLPLYGWDKNKGYGTEQHLQYLTVHGPSPLHRYTYSPVERATKELPPNRVGSKDPSHIVFNAYGLVTSHNLPDCIML